MIRVQNVFKSFNGNKAVNNISFEVPAGETLVLLGTSGSGKTTTLRLLNRLIEPSAGEILIDGKSIFTQPAELLRRNIGYVLQHHGLFPHYTVSENISVVPRLHNWPVAKIRERVNELLTKLQLPPETYAHLYPDQLSGGQKQRVGLARALAAKPPILLMDEPFGALDPLTRAEVKKEFLELDELKKKTIVLVTHDVPEAFELGNRIGLMDKGALIQLGTPAELLLHPQNAFVRDFFNQQRLSLELKSFPLATLWPNLPDAPENSGPALNYKLSLWDALEMLVNTQREVTIIKDGTQPRKILNFADLQKALAKD